MDGVYQGCYVSPSIDFIEVTLESVLCTSNDLIEGLEEYTGSWGKQSLELDLE